MQPLGSNIWTMCVSLHQTRNTNSLVKVGNVIPVTLSEVLFLVVCRIDAFLKSDQNRTASRLLTAYNEGDIEEIKKVACSSTVSNLDHAVIH